ARKPEWPCYFATARRIPIPWSVQSASARLDSARRDQEVPRTALEPAALPVPQSESGQAQGDLQFAQLVPDKDFAHRDAPRSSPTGDRRLNHGSARQDPASPGLGLEAIVPSHRGCHIPIWRASPAALHTPRLCRRREGVAEKL